MLATNAQIEAAEQKVAAATAAQVRRIQQSLRGHGRLTCIDCDEQIDAERRTVLPSALRCLECEDRRERRRRRLA